MTDELTRHSASRLSRMLRSRAVSPVEVVEAYLARIERLNPQLNAVVALAEDARERAREIEAALMRGDHVGRLAGVPVTVKDTIEVRGLRTTFGSRLRADYVPQTEGGALARLRAAGAIILGKTNASEMALDYTTDNPVYGRTNNPFDLARTPGGSSGGCAAAVSACMSAASLASDLVGSIRIPAHFCGVAGLKPTGGRMPRAGHFPPVEGPFSLGASLGPIARRVKDLSLFFDVLSGDATGQAGGDDSSAIAIESFSELRGRRVAFYTDDGVVPVTDETRDAVLKAAGALKDAGLLLVEARPPGVERATDLWLSLFSYATQRIVGAAYAGREEEAGAAARAIIERSGKTAPPSLDDYFDAWTERDRVRAQLLEWMESTPLVVAPVGAVPAFAHDAARSFVVGDRTIGAFRAFSYAQAFNVFDLPAVCVPAGQTVEGLPIGVQIAGRPFQEREVLAAARVVEDALGGWHAPPVALS